jgi:hypothetical protein
MKKSEFLISNKKFFFFLFIAKKHAQGDQRPNKIIPPSFPTCVRGGAKIFSKKIIITHPSLQGKRYQGSKNFFKKKIISLTPFIPPS